MNIVRLVLIIVSILFLSEYADAQEFTLYGTAADSCANGGDGSGEGSLYLVNQQTGNMQLIGPIGFEGVTALALLNDGRLVATARQGINTAVLIEINPNTGQGNLIGILGDNNNQGECGRFPGLAYDRVTNTLYASGFNCNDVGRSLWTINPNNSQATLIGEFGAGGGGLSLAMRSDGTLYLASLSGDTLSFYTVNRNSGLASLVGDIDANIPPVERLNINGMDFHPITGQLFGSSTEGDTGISNSYLVTANETIPSVNLIAQTVDCFDGIAFAERLPSNVPTLSEWGLIAMAGLLGMIGFIVVRRRQLTSNT